MRFLALFCVVLGLGLAGFGAWMLIADEQVDAARNAFADDLDGAPGTAHAGDRVAPVVTSGFKPGAQVPTRPGGDKRPDRTGGREGLMVVDPDGRPVPQAVVAVGSRFSLDADDYETALYADDEGIIDNPWDVGNHYSIFFCRHGTGAGWLTSSEVMRHRKRQPVLVLRRPATIIVEVRDEADRPVTKVELFLTARNSEREISESCVNRTGRFARRNGVTNVQGTATFVVDGADPYLGRVTEWSVAMELNAGLETATSANAPYDPDGDVHILLRAKNAHVLRIVAVGAGGVPRPLDLRIVLLVKSVDYDLETIRTLRNGTVRMSVPENPKRVVAFPASPPSGSLAPTVWGMGEPPWDLFDEGAWAAWQVRLSQLADDLTGIDVKPGTAETEVRVDFSAFPPVVAVPVLDPEGQPVRWTRLTLSGRGGVREVMTNEYGMLHLVGGRARGLELIPFGPLALRASSVRFSVPASGDDQHLPPAQLGPPRVLLSGLVLDHRGQPVPNVRLSINGPKLERDLAVAPDGRFKLTGTGPPDGTPLKVVARTRDGRHSEITEILCGTRTAEIPIVASGDVIARVLLSKPEPLLRVKVFHRVKGEVKTKWNGFDGVRPSGRMEIKGVPAGLLDLTFETSTGQKHTVTGVEVIAGTAARGRELDEIDLRADSTKLDVRVVDVNLAPAPGSFIYSAELRAGNLIRHEEEADGEGRAAIAHAGGAWSIVVAEGDDGAFGLVENPGSTCEVRLGRLSPCRFKLDPKWKGWLYLRPVTPNTPEKAHAGLPRRDIRLEGAPAKTISLSPGHYAIELVIRGQPKRDLGTRKIVARVVVDLVKVK
ncbi:MAG: hypothetical protein CMJ83_18475 [Planctomycetes bacterium]|nr:hypothetical protein [Planctomycetota bacterium]